MLAHSYAELREGVFQMLFDLANIASRRGLLQWSRMVFAVWRPRQISVLLNTVLHLCLLSRPEAQ